MRANTLTDAWRTSLHRTIRGLLSDISALAPHPDHPGSHGPSFLHQNAIFKQPAEYEGMLGSIMLESFLGTAFAQAADGSANDNAVFTGASSALNWSDALDLLSEYLEERGSDTGEGQGSFARVKWHTSQAFNAQAQDNPALDAYEADLDARRKLESALASYVRTLENIPSAPAPAPSWAA